MTDADVDRLDRAWALIRDPWHCSKGDLIHRISKGRLATEVKTADIIRFFKTFKYDANSLQAVT